MNPSSSEYNTRSVHNKACYSNPKQYGCNDKVNMIEAPTPSVTNPSLFKMIRETPHNLGTFGIPEKSFQSTYATLNTLCKR